LYDHGQAEIGKEQQLLAGDKNLVAKTSLVEFIETPAS
jgi:hypothetical protein